MLDRKCLPCSTIWMGTGAILVEAKTEIPYLFGYKMVFSLPKMTTNN